jgi:hypothetical protein
MRAGQTFTMRSDPGARLSSLRSWKTEWINTSGQTGVLLFDEIHEKFPQIHRSVNFKPTCIVIPFKTLPAPIRKLQSEMCFYLIYTALNNQCFSLGFIQMHTYIYWCWRAFKPNQPLVHARTHVRALVLFEIFWGNYYLIYYVSFQSKMSTADQISEIYLVALFCLLPLLAVSSEINRFVACL